MGEDLRFTEIEHKFVVDERFDVPRFRDALARMTPTRTTSVRVRDRYYLTEGGRGRRFVIRHRYDAELHHLTLKTFEADTEVRAEINLDLGHHAGDQQAQVEAFLSHLATDARVAASTQNQALSALLFLYREVLQVDLPWMDGVVRAKRPKHVPVVLTENEMRALLAQLDGTRWLVVSLLYSSGMRLLEGLRLRVKDVDFERREITVRAIASGA